MLYRNSTQIQQNRRRVGLLKLETGDRQIAGFVYLQPKCYSLLLDSVKMSLGVTENVKKKSDEYTYHTFIPHMK